MLWRGPERSEYEISYGWLCGIPVLASGFLVIAFINLVNKA